MEEICAISFSVCILYTIKCHCSETVRQLSEMHPTALTDVQSLPLEKIRKFLLRFAGVGPKVVHCNVRLGQSMWQLNVSLGCRVCRSYVARATSVRSD